MTEEQFTRLLAEVETIAHCLQVIGTLALLAVLYKILRNLLK